MPAQTYLFGCLSDNFGVLLHDPQTGATAAIDAPEAAPIEAALKRPAGGLPTFSSRIITPITQPALANSKRIITAASQRPAARRSALPMSMSP